MPGLHFAQRNEFVGAHGLYSIIHPLGYGKILKKMKRGAPVRSAVEQYEIHCIANRFVSPILKIPKAYELFGTDSYSMEHILPHGEFIPFQHYKQFPGLMCELNRFFGYMVSEGYFPYKFTILYYPGDIFILLDFSLFGSYNNGMVKFKHRIRPVQLMVAEYMYGLLSFLIFEEKSQIIQEKIEVYPVDL